MTITLHGPRPVLMRILGEDGKAFNIMGRFQRAAREQGWTTGQISAALDDMRSSNYNHLLAVALVNTTEIE